MRVYRKWIEEFITYMKKIVRLNSRLYAYLILPTLILFSASTLTKGQKKIEYTYFTNTSKQNSKIVDLTNIVKSESDKSSKVQINDSFLNVNFQSEFRIESDGVIAATEKSIRKTKEILYPLSLKNVKFYLLQQDEIPANYKITDEILEKDYFLYLWVFKDKEELNLDCHLENKMCENIYAIIPHELTHGAIENLTQGEGTRWFVEGLGNYVGAEVSRSFRPLVMDEKFEKNMPKLSLHREDIRKSLWIWDSPTNSPEKRSPKFVRNEWYRYIASQNLIKLIIEESEEKGIREPLTILLKELVRKQQNKQKSATSNELTEIIQDKLKVNPHEIGVLDKETQKSLVADANNILIQPNLKDSDKYYALNVLASIREIPFSTKVLRILIDEIYLKSNKQSFRELAATAIDIRNKQNEVDNVIQDFLKDTSQIKKTKLKDVKSKIRDLSISLL